MSYMLAGVMHPLCHGRPGRPPTPRWCMLPHSTYTYGNIRLDCMVSDNSRRASSVLGRSSMCGLTCSYSASEFLQHMFHVMNCSGRHDFKQARGPTAHHCTEVCACLPCQDQSLYNTGSTPRPPQPELHLDCCLLVVEQTTVDTTGHLRRQRAGMTGALRVPQVKRKRMVISRYQPHCRARGSLYAALPALLEACMLLSQLYSGSSSSC